MKTVCIQIGNSDDKLSQNEWHEYVENVDTVVFRYEGQRHFYAGSDTRDPWQNCCWIVVVSEADMVEFFSWLRSVATKWRQDSIAILAGDTQFV